MTLRLEPRGERVWLSVRLVPRAHRTALVDITPDGALRVRVQAPPVDGAANEALVRFLAREILGLAPSKVRIARGTTHRDKTVEIDADAPTVQAAIAAALESTNPNSARDS